MSGFKDVVRDSVQTVKGIVKIAMLSHGEIGRAHV